MSTPDPDTWKGRKYVQVVDAARHIFLSVGFDRGSMDDIAREAGVSKATIYSYFPEKDQLFATVVLHECDTYTSQLGDLIRRDLPTRAGLEHFAREMVLFLCSSDAYAVFRLSVVESQRFPDISRRFYERGPLTLRRLLADYLDAATARGDLAIADTGHAADQLVDLCMAGQITRLLLGVGDPPGPAVLERIAHEAVQTFWARYAAD